jgi:hypothetical protein
MLDVTLRETDIWRSIKKFWIDGIPNTKVYFNEFVVTPKTELDKWICVDIEGLRPAHVSNLTMTVFMFTKSDIEGDDLAALRDQIMELLFPGRITLYNTTTTPWTAAGGIIVDIVFQSVVSKTVSKADMKYIETILRWASVWS